MVISTNQEQLGEPCIAAKRYDNGETVYGVGFVRQDDEISYIIRRLETNELTDNLPEMATAIAFPERVHTDSIVYLEQINDFDLLQDNYDWNNLENISKMIEEEALKDGESTRDSSDKVIITEENRKKTVKSLIR